MKKLLFALVAILCLTACHKDILSSIDDLKMQYQNLDSRVTRLENLCKEMNTNITALQTIVDVLQSNDYITGITEIKKSGDIIGYTITFGKHSPITIYNGEDGKDGKDGADGSSFAPTIGIQKDTDGVYYWTLNGSWLLDDQGNKLRVTGEKGEKGDTGAAGQNGQNGTNGTDGVNGANGQNGQNGITPQLKIEEGFWFVSYNGGTSWTMVGRATGEQGEKGDKGDKGDTGDTGATGPAGQDGQNGQDGAKGDTGDSMFSSVTYDANYVYFTLADGTQLKIARGNNSSTTGTHADTDIIEFKDIIVRKLLLVNHNIDSNHGGEISYGEAAAYHGKIKMTGVQSFNEFQYFTGDITSVNLYPSSQLFEIILPAGLQKIEEKCFQGCIFNRIEIPNTVTMIGANAFRDNTKLENITIPGSCDSIDSYAFYGCTQLNTVTIEDGCKNIGEQAFYNCPITTLSLPNTIETMGASAFYGNRLTEFTFPENLRSGFQVFNQETTNISSIIWNCINCAGIMPKHDGKTYNVGVGYAGASYYTNDGVYNTDNQRYTSSPYYMCYYINNVQIGPKVLVIPEFLFASCSINSVNLPSSVTRVKEYAFYKCPLDTITIGENVTSIGDLAFCPYYHTPVVYCKSLTPPILGNNVFGTNGNSIDIIFVPRSAVNDYRTAWSNYASKIAGYDF